MGDDNYFKGNPAEWSFIKVGQEHICGSILPAQIQMLEQRNIIREKAKEDDRNYLYS